MRQADIDDGRSDGTSSSAQAEIVELRRELRVAKMEVEILKRAAAFFAKENVLPNRFTPSSPGSVRTCPSRRVVA